jgi:DNA-binding PadR family transcriptional regulator
MQLVELTEIGCLILSTLIEPTHGYEIMKSIENEFNGHLSIGPATLYTTLSKMVKAELCSFEEVANKKVYLITNKGKSVLTEEVNKRQQALQFMINQLSKGDKL